MRLSGGGSAISAVLLVLFVATALQPTWLVRIAAFPAWLGGFWRIWLPLIAAAGWLTLAYVHSTSSGATWRWMHRAARTLRRRLPALAAVCIGAVTLLLVVGVATVGT